MKKVLLIFTVLFASCFEVQVKPREVNAQSVNSTHGTYSFSIKTIQGMEYGIWYYSYGSSGEVAAIHVVNLTKDQLEVELLRKQLNETK